MITTLSGEFTEFKASYTHSTELGGSDTSLIRDLNAYFMVHEVMNDQPGRDGLLDFLAETLGGEQLIPDTLYESDCNTLPVNRLTDVELLDFSGLAATVRAKADIEDWIFIRLDDPGQAKFSIANIVRSDGKVLNPNNYWTNIRYRDPDNFKLTYLNIFDFVALGEYQYMVTYEPSGTDIDPPLTTLRFFGPNQEKDGKYFVLPETQLFFIAEDDSPVGTYYKLDGAPDFVPAYPFNIYDAGEHTLEFYSTDAEGNEEAHKIATVVVSLADPGIENLTADTTELFIVGDSLSVRPTTVTIGFNGVVTASRLDAKAEVFRGIFGYPTVSGVPSSPTSSGDATIIVGGENVDYYRYRIGGGAWSDEFTISQPIQLSGLVGTVHLSVSGRSQYGDYLPDSEAVIVSWTVDPGALPIVITGIPEIPTRTTLVNLNVLGSDNYCYRVDGTYYRPDTGAGNPVTLTRLSDGEHTVEVLARAGAGEACPADGAGTTVVWTVNRLYGLAFPDETRVRQEFLGQVDANFTEFVWDGRSDSGVVVPPGWYSVRIMVEDGLGRLTGAVTLVYVGDLVADGTLLSDSGNARQKEAHAFRGWVVWQDQRNGSWDIFAQDLNDAAAIPVAITGNSRNQERPHTDGKFVVWEDRQADGTWDIVAKELGSANPVFAITATSDLNEQKPAIYWPWVVFQSKPVADPGAPWQVMAYNIITDTTAAVDSTTQDQLDPAIQQQRVVWQDFRDVGYGEIYFKDLRSGEVRRITDNQGGQYHPVIFDQWIVWDDNRNGQLDLYGYNLRRNTEVQLTDTPEDESRPYINGKWVVCEEDSAGGQNINLRLLHLSNLASIQLTNAESEKEKPSMASNKIVWVDLRNGHRQVMTGSLPDLQPVFNNRNTVAVTEGMLSDQGDAYTLLKLWNEQAGVSEITRYTTLLPQPVAESVSWISGAPVGDNFTLEAGSFLWVKFNDTNILDLGEGTCTSLNLVAGPNMFSYSCFPDHYSAFRLIRELGTANINALRVLDSDTGRWQTASVVNSQIVGEDFRIQSVAVLMLDMINPVPSWKPGEEVP
jgi:beta propeller repeat protein